MEKNENLSITTDNQSTDRDSAVQPSTSQPATLEIAQFTPDMDVQIDKKALQAADASAINMALEYHEFAQDEPVRGIYLGCTPYRCVNKQTGEEAVLTGAVFVDENRNPKINCAVKFVTTVSRFPLKTAFEATFKKTKKTGSGGNMQMFDIRLLNYPVQ